MLSSMVSLQINDLRDEAPRLQLEKVAGRLRTLAIVHEELSSRESINKTDVRVFLQSIIVHLYSAITSEPIESRLKIDLDEIPARE